MTGARLLAASAAVALALLAGSAPARADDVAIESFTHEPGAGLVDGAFVVTGTTKAADGAELTVTVGLGEADGARGSCAAQGGRFAFRSGPLGAKVLPGVYRATARVGADGEPAEATVRVGTEADEARERRIVREKYLAILEGFRIVHDGLGQWGGFTVSAIERRLEQARAAGEEAEEVEGLVIEWDHFAEDIFELNFDVARYEHVALGDYVLASYFPGVDGELDRLHRVMDGWYHAFGRKVYEIVGREAPARYRGEETEPFDALYRESIEISARIYRALEAEVVAWGENELRQPESPDDVKGMVFRSSLTGFEIRKPGPAWTFVFERTTPGLRVRMVPKPGSKWEGLSIGVEIHDFPQAESFEDLSRLREINTIGRWNSFKQVSRAPLELVDKKTPDGKRRGLDMVFTSTYQGRVFKLRDYALFSVGHDRAYDVVALGPIELFDRHEKLIDIVCRSLRLAEGR